MSSRRRRNQIVASAHSRNVWVPWFAQTTHSAEYDSMPALACPNPCLLKGTLNKLSPRASPLPGRDWATQDAQKPLKLNYG